MTDAERPPDPTGVHTLDDLVQALNKLRRRGARRGQVRLSVRDLAARTKKAPSTLDAYLRGTRLPPADVYEDLLHALGIPVAEMRPWLDAWERIADRWSPRQPVRHPVSYPPTQPARKSELIPRSETLLYRLTGHRYRAEAQVGIVTGDIRRVHCADVWVNSENTDMRMSRFEEYSISAIIRFEGATRDAAGRVVEDSIAEELTGMVSGRTPVAAGSAITTGPGELAARNGVRHIIHVAAVRGEPGEGYRQVADVGRCVTNALAEADRLAATGSVRSILLPLFGTGVAGGQLEPTVRAMVGAIADHFSHDHAGGLRVVYLLASTKAEQQACRAALADGPFEELPPQEPP
jgi:O-acetyl-ADP-ribose deacetylase (regulator of RNase III)/transcriptional regulator with XRE-family HTH domain